MWSFSDLRRTSLVLERHTPVLPWTDPLQILAEALVREATAVNRSG